MQKACRRIAPNLRKLRCISAESVSGGVGVGGWGWGFAEVKEIR